MLEEEADPEQGRHWPTGQNGPGKGVAAGVLPMGWFCSCGRPSGECGTGRNSGWARGLWTLGRGTSMREYLWLGIQGFVYYVKANTSLAISISGAPQDITHDAHRLC